MSAKKTLDHKTYRLSNYFLRFTLQISSMTSVIKSYFQMQLISNQ